MRVAVQDEAVGFGVDCLVEKKNLDGERAMNMMRSKKVLELINLYDAYKIDEFMAASEDCQDPDIVVMRLITGVIKFTISVQDCSEKVLGAVKSVERRAVSGDYVSQANLSLCCRFGVGVEKDLGKSLVWAEKSAAQNYPRGQYELGRAFESFGDHKMIMKAIRYYRKSAKQGCNVAMYNLGRLLLVNVQARVNVKEVESWLWKAAENGIGQSISLLCQYYSFAKRECDKWGCLRLAWERGLLSRAMENCDDELLESLFKFSHTRNKLRKYRMAELPIEDLKKLAKKDPKAKTYLAYLYYDGTFGLGQDDKTARKLFAQAARAGVSSAQCMLGECFYRARGCAYDAAKAFEWFKKAAEKDEFQAVGWLGLMYSKGIACRKSIKTAIRYISKAAALGNEWARYDLALRYLGFKKGVRQNPTAGVNLLWSVACQGRLEAIIQLAICYLEGKGVVKDVERGEGLLAVAEKCGSVCSKNKKPYQDGLGYLSFYDAVLSREEMIEPSILRMLEENERES